MRIKQWPLLIMAACLCSSCATRPHVYTAPDATKMNASRQRLGRAVTAARGTAAQSRAKVAEAKRGAERIKLLSGDTAAKLTALQKNLPEQYHAQVQQVIDSHQLEAAEQADQALRITYANNLNEQLAKQLDEAEAAKAEHETDDLKYQGEAGKIASSATEERDARIKVEKALSWYRWHSLFLKVVGVLVVVSIIAVLILWMTGHLAKAAGIVASKL